MGGVLALVDSNGNINISHAGVQKTRMRLPLKERERAGVIARNGRGFIVGGTCGTLAFYNGTEVKDDK